MRSAGNRSGVNWMRWNEARIMFARVVTDYAIYGYLLDLFVLPAHRGKGYGRMMIDAVLAEPKLAELQILALATEDAHELYEQFGFVAHPHPQKLMVRKRSDVDEMDIHRR